MISTITEFAQVWTLIVTLTLPGGFQTTQVTNDLPSKSACEGTKELVLETLPEGWKVNSATCIRGRIREATLTRFIKNGIS